MSSTTDDGRPLGASWDRIRRAGPDPDDDPDDTVDPINPELAHSVTTLIDWLVERDRWRILDGRTFEDLYGGRWVDGEDLLPGVSAYCQAGGDPVKLNFARNAVDFVQTKVCAETPTVVATERAGGYAAERRASLLTQYIDRLTESCGLVSLLPEASLTALRSGTAVLKTHGSTGRPGVELVPAEWVHVDAVEARCGDPRSIYERRPVSRRSLLDRWVGVSSERGDEPDREVSDTEAAIVAATSARDPLDVTLSVSMAGETTSDLVDVYECWALPDDVPGADPGRHVICVDGAVLLDEDWTFPRFPHAFFMVDPPPRGRGFWAQGLLAQLDECQAEIDFLLAQVSEQIRLARLKVFVQVGSDVNEDHLSNSDQGGIVKYDGVIPHFQTPPSVSEEALEHIQWLVKELYETAGMSESGASSQRPAGVNSGRAILYFHDFQTRRFVELVRRYGDLVVSVVDRLLDRAEELHVRVDDGDDEVRDGSRGRTGGSRRRGEDDSLSWSKVRMDREDFTISLEQVSATPRTYAGREQRIEQLISQGQAPEGYFERYLSDPNAWLAEHRASAQALHLEWLMSRLVDVDLPVPPLSDKLDLAMALTVLTGEVLDLIRKGADEAIVARVEDFYDRIVQRQRELAPAPPPAPAGPPQQTNPALPNGGLNPTTPT